RGKKIISPKSRRFRPLIGPDPLKTACKPPFNAGDRAPPRGHRMFTPDQLSQLRQVASQLHPADRPPFLRALRAAFERQTEICDGELSGMMRGLLESGAYRAPPVQTRVDLERYAKRRSRLKSAAPIA